MTKKQFILCICLFLSILGFHARAQETDAWPGRVEFFAGVDVNYRFISYTSRPVELLLYVTPAVKWHPGKDWQLTLQGAIPFVNLYGDYYRYPRINIAALSKELYAGNFSFKFSGGLFSRQRYGLDAKFQWAVTPWFALEGQISWTGFYEMTNRWAFSAMDRVTGLLSARFYIPKYRTEFRITGGRYIYADYGLRFAWMKHFSRFISVGAFVQTGDHYGNLTLSPVRLGAGAQLIFMLPWQGNGKKRVSFRPASNIRLTYDYKSDEYGMKMFATDPEENERSGNFSKSHWGVGGR